MNTIKTVALMTFMMVLLIVVGGALGGQTGMVIAFLIALALNFGSYWFSDKIVLKMYKAKEVTEQQAPQLYGVVRDLANRAQLPMPKVYVMQNDTPNAFATGRDPDHSAVAVTSGILKLLNRDELEGVIAHELAHIKHRDILISTIAATLVGTITFIARMAGWAALLGGRDERDGSIFSDLAMIILAPIAAVLIQLAISRSREYAADAGVAHISGKPLALASALQKLEQIGKQRPMRDPESATAHMFIVNPLSGKSFTKLFSTHPATEERVKRLNEIAQGRR